MLQVLFGAFLISFSSVFVKLVHVGPTSSMFYRFFFGGAALLCAVIVRRESVWKGFHTMKWAIMGGFIFSIDLFFWHRSIHYVGPGLATILANFQVFSLSVIGALFLKEKLTFRFLISVPLAFTGLFMIIGWQFDSMDMLYVWGIIYGLLTAVCFTGLTLVMQKSQKIPDKHSPVVNMMWVCFFGSLLGGVLVVASGETFVIPDIYSLFFLVVYGAVCTGLGWAFISKGLPKITVSLAGLVLILQPTGSFIWDMLIFSRPTTGLQLTGAVLTISAIYLGASRKK